MNQSQDTEPIIKHKTNCNKPINSSQKYITTKLTPFRLQIIANSNTFPIVIFPWYNSIYSSFTNVQLVYYSIIADTPYDLLIYADTTLINSVLGVNTTGFRTLTLSIPNNDFILNIFVNRGSGTIDPIIENINLHYN